MAADLRLHQGLATGRWDPLTSLAVVLIKMARTAVRLTAAVLAPLVLLVHRSVVVAGDNNPRFSAPPGQGQAGHVQGGSVALEGGDVRKRNHRSATLWVSSSPPRPPTLTG